MRPSTHDQAIVLTRTNYGETDRILTVLTKQNGKKQLIAKGVRKEKSKLAGGVELLSVADIGWVHGRGSLGTITSARLLVHFQRIATNVDATMKAYDLLALIHKNTEDDADNDYFVILQNSLALLDAGASTQLVELWLLMQLMQLGGALLDLNKDADGNKLQPDQTYSFDGDHLVFRRSDQGVIGADHIKLMRLCAATQSTKVIAQLRVEPSVVAESLDIARICASENIRF